MAELKEQDRKFIVDMFTSMDVDGDGCVNFQELLDSEALQGLNKTSEDVKQMLAQADNDRNGSIELNEFIEFVASIMGKTSSSSSPRKSLSEERKKQIRSMFIHMDVNGDGFVDLKDFKDFCMENEVTENLGLSEKRIEQLYERIRRMDQSLSPETEEKGITLTDLTLYFEQEAREEENLTIKSADVNMKAIKSIDDIEEYIGVVNATDVNVCNVTVEHLGQALRDKKAMEKLLDDNACLANALQEMEVKRWRPFASFRRNVSSRPVMTSSSGILSDLVPGKYGTKDLLFSADLAPIEPEKTVVYGVKWVEGSFKDGKWDPTSKLIFPNSFNGEVETDIATTETVGYYGGLLIESTLQRDEKDYGISLEERHVLQDFTYTEDYIEKWVCNPEGAKGPALEHHTFAHLDMNLGPIKRSGHFVMAKFINPEKTTLAITGFQVPTRHTIYTPRDILHTNNYLQGTWRTMLADGKVNEGKLMRNNKMLRLNFK